MQGTPIVSATVDTGPYGDARYIFELSRLARARVFALPPNETRGHRVVIDIYDTELWYKVMQVNLNAPFLLTKACIPLMRKSSAARIVFTADEKSSAYWGAYGVAKAGQLSLMQILADELESKNIPVNAVMPGPVRTRFRTMAYPAEDMRKLTKPEEITDAFVYLLSDKVTETGKTFKPEDIQIRKAY